MKYTIFMRPSHYDDWERLDSSYNRKLIDGIAEHTNKRNAEKEMHRLQRLVKAGNGLRKIEGSKERHYYEFRIMPDYSDIRKKVMDTPEKVFNTRTYQYYIDGGSHLCRAKLSDMDTMAMYDAGAIEVLD